MSKPPTLVLRSIPRIAFQELCRSDELRARCRRTCCESDSRTLLPSSHRAFHSMKGSKRSGNSAIGLLDALSLRSIPKGCGRVA